MKEAALPPNLPPPRTFPTAARLFHADANDGALPAGSSRGTPLWGERQKSNGYCHEKEICQTEIPDRRLLMRPAISELSVSVFSGCLNVSKHQKTISGFRPQKRKHLQLPKEWPKPERESNGIRPQSREHPQSSKNDPTQKSNSPAQSPRSISYFLYRYAKTGDCAGERSRGGGLEGTPLLKRRPLQGLPLQ